MEDARVWTLERSLWQATEDRYHERVDAKCVMALSHDPYLVSGEGAIEAVSHTPDWDDVKFSDEVISRPLEGLIVAGYRVKAARSGMEFSAACTSVYRRRAHEDWTVIQHAQVAGA